MLRAQMKQEEADLIDDEEKRLAENKNVVSPAGYGAK
jgi:hypothetical protein